MRAAGELAPYRENSESTLTTEFAFILGGPVHEKLGDFANSQAQFPDFVFRLIEDDVFHVGSWLHRLSHVLREALCKMPTLAGEHELLVEGGKLIRDPEARVSQVLKVEFVHHGLLLQTRQDE